MSTTLQPSTPLAVRLALAPLSIVLGALVLVSSVAAPTSAQETPAIIPVLASSELAVGPNRFLFGLTDRQGALVAAPDVDVHLRFYDVDRDPEAVAFETDARFLWAIEGERGLYAATVDYPAAGRWATRFDATFPDGRAETVRMDYDVQETTSTPPIGTPGPAVDSPTAGDVGGDLRQITTDAEPVERFYELSIDEAIVAGAPAIIAFVTPAFCQSATCGPTLDKVKSVAAAHPEVNVVQVEPYVMQMQDGMLQPQLTEEGWLQAAPWAEAWGLRTEPFVAVVDADGLVRAKFEGALTTEELEEALDELT
jgi:hypothetical protein